MKNKILLLLAAGLMAALISRAALPEEVISATLKNHDYLLVPATDSTFRASDMGYGDWQYGVGTANNAPNKRNGSPILGFKLPALTGPATKVTFSVTKTGFSGSGSWTWYVQVYAFDKNINPPDYTEYYDTASPYYYRNIAYHGAEADSNPNVRCITLQFFNRLTPDGRVEIDITEFFKPGGALADFYDAEGNPVSKNGMIWFRLNQGLTLGATAQRLLIERALGNEGRAKLEFTVQPMPATTALINPEGPEWGAGGAKLAYLNLLNREINLQRDQQEALIKNAINNNAAVPASAINYAYSAAFSMSVMSSGTAALSIESHAYFTNVAKNALLAATNAIGSPTPAVATQQVSELAKSQGALVGLYRVLAGMSGVLDSTQKAALPVKIGDGAQAILAQADLPYGSYGTSAQVAQGLAATAGLLSTDPRRADWIAYADSIWNDWKQVNDTVENARGSIGLWLYSTLLQGDETGLGKNYQDQLKDAVAKASLERFAADVAPNGTLPDYGNTYWDEGIAYWLYASEKLGQLHNRPDFLVNAVNIAAHIGRNLGNNIKISDITGMVEACRIASGPETRTSGYDGAYLGLFTDSKGTKHWDKISLRTGNSAVSAFASLNLHDRGGHGFDNAGALSLYTSGPSVLLHSLGGSNPWANQQQGTWAVSGLTPANLLATSGRYPVNISTKWLVNFRWPGSVEAKPALDPAKVTGFFIRLKNNTDSLVTPSVTVEEITGAKADGTLHVLSVTSWSATPSIAAGESADIASAALTLNLSDYVYLLVKWKSSNPDMVETFGISGATLMPTAATDGRPASTTLITGPGSSVADAYAEDDVLIPKGGMTRIMVDNAGREVIHHRDIHLRAADGALFVLDSFEFTESGDYTVGPVWHVQNIKSASATTVIAGDTVQIDTNGNKAAEAPSNMRFDFVSDSSGVTIVRNTAVPAGRHPQKEHFAATLSGARAAGDFVKVLTIIRPGEPTGTFSVEYSPFEKRYVNYTDDLGRVVTGINPFTTVEGVSPDYAVIPGTDIKIMGRNFATATKVFMGEYEVPASAWKINNDRQITVRVPLNIPPTGYIKIFSPERGEGTSPNLYTIAVALPAHQPLPESQIVVAGKKLTLVASTVGNPQPTWQWQVSKDDGKTWENVDGAISGTLEVNYVTAGMNGWKYRYYIENYHSASVSFPCEIRIIPGLLSRPTAIVIDAANDLYVGDSGLFTINRIGNDSKFVKIAGTIGTSGTTNGRFISPSGIAIAPNKTLMFTDANAHRIYWSIDPDKALRGEQVFGYITSSTTGTIGTPTGIVTDSAGTIYFADTGMHIIKKLINVSGTFFAQTIAGLSGTSGMVDGHSTEARFNSPTGLALDQLGQVLYVADTGNHAIRVIDLHSGSNQYRVARYAGAFGVSGTDDGALLDARFNAPHGIIVDGDALLVADTANSTIREIVSGTVTTIAGAPGMHAMMDATGTKARFDHPVALAMDTNGIIYVADTENGAIRKITPDDKVTTPIWDDFYKADEVPPSTNDGLLNKGEGGGGGAPSLWFLGALAMITALRRALRREN